MPTTTAHLALPRPEGADDPDVVGDLVALTDRLAAVVQLYGTHANRPAASAALNGATYYSTDKAMLWQCVAGAWTLLMAYAPSVAAFPANPIDGQECKKQISYGGTNHFRYSSTKGAWEPVGKAVHFNTARFSRVSAASLAHGVTAGIWFDTVDYVSEGAMQSGAGSQADPFVLTVQRAGWYRAQAWFEFAQHATGDRQTGISRNRGGVITPMGLSSARAISFTATRMPVIAPRQTLQVGDKIEISAFQNSGAALNVTAWAELEWDGDN